MSRLLRRPLACFALLIIGAIGLALGTHGFRTQVEPDSQTYLTFDWSSPATILSSQRTWGYPLFLRLVSALSADPRAIAIGQGIVWLLAAVALYRGLVASGHRRQVAAPTAAILLFGQAARTFTPVALADSVGTALSVISAACFLGLQTPSPSLWTWLGLALASFGAWIVRPAFLFLIPLWPLLTLQFSATLLRSQLHRGRIMRRTLVCLLATTVPFVAYGTLRWLTVGHWGLVSFGGYNIIGVAGQFLSDSDVQELPGDVQPLAREIIRRRADLPAITAPHDFAAMESSFNPTIWQLAVPAAREAVGDESVAVNQLLTRLSQAVLRRHGTDYARWLAWNARHACQQAAIILATDRSMILLGLWFLAVNAWRLIAGGGPHRIASRSSEAIHWARVESHLLLWTAIALAAAKTLLVILVEPAIGRYMVAALVLVPPAAALWVAGYVSADDSDCVA
jgi:hypothetical protein